jgi:hypothetical protein
MPCRTPAALFSPQQLDLPVKQNWTFVIFPNAPSGVQCNGIALFDTNMTPDD